MPEPMVIELKLNKEATRVRFSIWSTVILLLLALSASWMLTTPLAGIASSEPTALAFPWVIPAALGTSLFFVLTSGLENTLLRRGLRTLLWGLALLVLTPQALIQGVLLWMDILITRWNSVYEGGLALLSVPGLGEESLTMLSALFDGQLHASPELLSSLQAVLILLAMSFSGIFAEIVRDRHRTAGIVLGLLLLLLQYLFSWVNPWADTLYSCAVIGLSILTEQAKLSRHARFFFAVAVLSISGMTALLPASEWTAMSALRAWSQQELQLIRYGEKRLPEGALAEEAMLHTDTDTLLRVQSEQQKNLYLRGFVGAAYQDGCWIPFSDAAYGGSYAGLLSWLETQGFDPLTESAQYYALSDPTDAPLENHLLIQNVGTSRDYFYIPVSTKKIGISRANEKQDQRFTVTGLYGSDAYTVAERSSEKPSELTVRAAWVQHPETEAQEQYASAEAVYRSFVYDRYTVVPDEMKPLLEQRFWSDEVHEKDSIYAAIDHVREVLSTSMKYTRDPALSATDAGESSAEETAGDRRFRAFLRGEEAGNAVMYASAAAEALRLQGIATRYVEGYYVPGERLGASENGSVDVNGQDTHAWIEVYFDGIGWLPVDVTPGYYYDAVQLQEMVSLPETPKKTAMLENSDTGADPLSQEGESSAQQEVPLPQRVLESIGRICLGVVSALLIFLFIAFLLLELLRFASEWNARRRFQKADPKTRIALRRRWLYHLLMLRDIDAHFAVDTEKVDESVTKQLADVNEGDYTRVVYLFEKAIYGEEALERYELRTIDLFMDKLQTVERPIASRLYWRLRYARLLPDTEGSRTGRRH